MNGVVSSRRCSICALTLPPAQEWKKCPQCGEDTDAFGNAEPTTSQEEAESILKHRKFEEYLEQEGKV